MDVLTTLTVVAAVLRRRDARNRRSQRRRLPGAGRHGTLAACALRGPRSRPGLVLLLPVAVRSESLRPPRARFAGSLEAPSGTLLGAVRRLARARGGDQHGDRARRRLAVQLARHVDRDPARLAAGTDAGADGDRSARLVSRRALLSRSRSDPAGGPDRTARRRCRWLSRLPSSSSSPGRSSRSRWAPGER